jgi:hypothetical protein
MELAAKAKYTRMVEVKKLLLIVALLAPFISLAQEDDRDVKARPWQPPVSQDRFILDFNNDMWLEYPDSIETRPYSLGIGSYIMYDYIIGKSPISFAWGYGFSSHNIHHNGVFVEDSLDGKPYTKLLPLPSDYDYKKNKLAATYVEVPIELRFRTRGSSPFKLYLGGRVGYLVNLHSKTKDDDGKRKFYGLEGQDRLRYGLTGRIGVGQININCFYGLSTLLLEGEGDRIVPWSLGLSIFLL